METTRVRRRSLQSRSADGGWLEGVRQPPLKNCRANSLELNMLDAETISQLPFKAKSVDDDAVVANRVLPSNENYCSGHLDVSAAAAEPPISSERHQSRIRAVSLDLSLLLGQKGHKGIIQALKAKPPIYSTYLRGKSSAPSMMAELKNILTYQDLTRPADQEKIKEHILRTFQLANLVSEFIGKFADAYDSFSLEVESLIGSFREASSDYTTELEGFPSEQTTIGTAWLTLLQGMSTDAENSGDFAKKLKECGKTRLAEVVSCKRLHMEEVHECRQRIDAMLDDSEEKLHKMRVELRQETHTYRTHQQHYTVDGGERKDRALATCAAAHNDYVLQLIGTNRLIEEYHKTSLPWILNELSLIHSETCNGIKSAIRSLCLLAMSKANDQAGRYDEVLTVFKQVSAASEAHHIVKNIRSGRKATFDDVNYMPKPHVFKSTLENSDNAKCLMKGEIILDSVVSDSVEEKRRILLDEKSELSGHMTHLQQRLSALEATQQRLLSSHDLDSLQNMQKDICRLSSQLHLSKVGLSVVTSQISALGVEERTGAEVVEPASHKPHKNEGGIKTMWRKFAKKATKKTPDKDVSCSPQAGGSLTALNNNLANDQPTASEEPSTREGKADPVYNLLKGASMLRKTGEGDNSISLRNLTRQNTSSSGRSTRSSSPAAAYAAARPRQMLNKRMKSFSLDTPDAPKQVDQSTKMKSSSYTNNTCIPGSGLSPAAARRRNLMTSQRRGLSVDIEDQEGQSSYNNSNSSVYTSHSGSPCYSRRNHQSEGYMVGDSVVAIFDVEGVEPRDISFKAGDKVVLTDTGDPEWWAGMCQGYTGYFPSRYVLTVSKGQSLYRVIKPLHLSDSDFRLLRDQVVVDEGGGDANSMNIYTKDVKTGRPYQLKCPHRYLERLTTFN